MGKHKNTAIRSNTTHSHEQVQLEWKSQAKKEVAALAVCWDHPISFSQKLWESLLIWGNRESNSGRYGSSLQFFPNFPHCCPSNVLHMSFVYILEIYLETSECV